MIRPGVFGDLLRIAEIQAASPEAAQWAVSDYSYIVAEIDGEVAGFAVWRGVGEGEWELLNIAVDPAYRRRGVAWELLGELPAGRIFIEVRESNAAARSLYENRGFTLIGRRRGYYESPDEDGIVMTLQK